MNFRRMKKMGNKDVGVIEEMNQKISSDLGVEDKTKKNITLIV